MWDISTLNPIDELQTILFIQLFEMARVQYLKTGQISAPLATRVWPKEDGEGYNQFEHIRGCATEWWVFKWISCSSIFISGCVGICRFLVEREGPNIHPCWIVLLIIILFRRQTRSNDSKWFPIICCSLEIFHESQICYHILSKSHGIFRIFIVPRLSSSS